MTAILAIDFIYQIVVISDCRVSWQGGNYRPQDNLQKIYPVGPTGILGFSGDVYCAKIILRAIKNKASNKPLPPSAQIIAEDISKWARESYSEIPTIMQKYVEFMFVASDYGNISLVTENVIFAKSILIKMVSPHFNPTFERDAIRLGYSVNYPIDNIILNRDNMLDLGLSPEGERFKVGIMIGTFAQTLASYSPSQVGGMFSVGIIDPRGVRWFPYSIGDLELKIEGGKFVQYNHYDGRRIPLKVLWNFDPGKPEAGNLMFTPPKI